jgi:Uma2 family endonuclease
MAVAVTLTTEDASVVQLRPRPFTIDDVEAMVRAGILRDSERIELIEGQIVEMHAQGTRHIWAVSRVTRAFARRDDVVVTSQSTFEIDGRSGPEPDVTVLRADTSQHRRPSAETALLVVEVADTSLTYDRNVKAPLYARAGVPEYWIVDLNGERVEVYVEPSEAGYRASRLYLRGESLNPAFAADMLIVVDEILGPSEESVEGEQTAEPS